MNQIEIFNSPEFGSIRTLEQNGKVLFCGTDVATALGYTNPRKAVRDHTRGGTKCSIGVQTGKKADGSPAVQMVEMLFIRSIKISISTISRKKFGWVASSQSRRLLIFPLLNNATMPPAGTSEGVDRLTRTVCFRDGCRLVAGFVAGKSMVLI